MNIFTEKAKTLPYVVENCDFIRKSQCKDCFGQCEFEGTEHFKGKWVKLEDIAKLFEKCAYIDDEGNSAFLCTACEFYHGVKKGCSWKKEDGAYNGT